MLKHFNIGMLCLFLRKTTYMRLLLSILFIASLFSCAPDKVRADLLIKNGTIYTVNSEFDMADAVVTKDGKILEIGRKPELELKYSFNEVYDAKGQTVLPGLIDGHAHLFNLGVTMQQVDLFGTESFEEVIDRVVAFQKEKNVSFIRGRGWDQNDWKVKEFPNNKILDSLFPDTPVALTRVDGHAMIANKMALKLAKITTKTKIKGGVVALDKTDKANPKLTGLLIDSPMDLVFATYPKESESYLRRVLQDAEKKCLSLGLTTINDAGLNKNVIDVIEKMHQEDSLKIRVYAMVSNSKENLDYYLKAGIIKTDRLHVRSVKVYADGALGSRGATLRNSYSDKENHFGAMITPQKELKAVAKRIAAAGYQMNTHAIGDSANVAVIRAYQEAMDDTKDMRWKIEHAQLVTMEDFDAFSKNIIPSIQPTHATSDMYWAEDRIGSERIKGAYAYKTLLDKAGMIVLGTDFPVERVNPMHTFYAAVARKDLKNYPEEGYRTEEALSREETLKGMTIWAAYSNFEENEKGSIEAGKFADFTILDRDIMKVNADSIPKTKVMATYINGERVYSGN
ncbi:MAG: putative amidohydrolase YtcJ [Planctomycetota bacterium]|jgi:predicted amidohydrolase YtcJ